MTPERIQIADGMYLNHIRSDRFKTDFVSVDFLSQLKPDSAAEQALLPFVLLRGTKRLPDTKAVTRELEMLYGSRLSPTVYKTGSVQSFGFSSYPLSPRYTDGTDVTGEIFRLIGEMLTSPAGCGGLLSEEYTESEKRIMTDRLRAQINDKWHYALTRCSQIMSDGSNTALPECGTEEQLSKVTAASLTARLSSVLTDLRCEIWYIGSSDSAPVADRVRGIFPFPGRKKPAALYTERIPFRGELKSVTETENISQSRLCLGYRTGCLPESPELPAYTMFSEILSGSPMSKLFVGVREKLSLCYDCSAVSDINRGMMIVSSGIDAANAGKAEEAINAQLAALKNGEISDAEFDAALRSVTNGIKSMYDDAGAIKTWYLRRGMFAKVGEPLEFLDRIGRVTKDDVARVAAGIIPDTRYLLKAEAGGNE